MHLIEVVPCGPLAGRFPSLKIAATTAAEAIEGWSRQVSQGRIPTVMQALGFETEEQLREPTRVRKLKLYPAMFGGGGFGRILLGAAMIGVGFLTGGLGTAIGASLIVSGSVTAIMGVVSLFMKAPTLSKEQDPEASKYLGVGRNTTKIGTPIGIGGGRMMLGGHYLSLSVNSSDLVYGRFPETPS